MNINNANNSSTYTSAAYSSKGISGLASGLDTESLVQSMLSGLQTKIDKQNQQKQVLEWKQEFYRDIISDINSFQAKFLDLTSNTSLRLNSFFNTMTATSSSSAVSVVADSGAKDGEFEVQVARLATATSVSSKASSNSISMNMAAGKKFEYSREINIKINGEDKKVNLSKSDGTAMTEQEIVNAINSAVGSNIASLRTETTYKTQDGKTTYTQREDGKFYDSKGKLAELTEDEKRDLVSQNDTKTVGIKFSSDKSFEISGSSAGMSVIGLKGTVKSEKVDSVNTIETKSINAKGTEFGKVNGTVTVNLDGVKKNIAITEGQTMEDFKNSVQSAFGTSVEFTQDASGNFTGISVKGTGRSITLSANEETMKAIGFDKTSVSNRILRSDTIKDLGLRGGYFQINGKDIDYDEDDTISTLMNKINSSGAGVTLSFDDLSGKFSLTANSTGEGFDIKMENGSELFEKLGFRMNENYDFADMTAGQNALVNINGTTIERANNNFTYNGMTVKIKATTGTYQTNASGEIETDSDGKFLSVAGKTDNAAKIATSRDTTKIIDTIKSFVEEYNKLIEKLNKFTHEKATYKKYPPLTDAQKKEMSEKEIELWEEKSKEGLLRNDRNISTFLNDMRSAMYTKGDSSLLLSNIGINSSDNWQDYGKLSIDEDKLKKALESNADGVKTLFTSENGLAARLTKICKAAANTSSGSQGSLVAEAGVVGKGSEKSNVINKQIESITKKLESLNMLYEKRKDRYWKQFNAMETALSNMDSQSSWLNNMLGY